MMRIAMPRIGNKTPCPHCDTACLTIKTNQITRLVREITYSCRNCGHIFVSSLTPVRTLAPSDRPRADVRIQGAT